MRATEAYEQFFSLRPLSSPPSPLTAMLTRQLNVSECQFYFYFFATLFTALIANLTRKKQKNTNLQCFRKHTSLQDKALSEWGVGIETTQQRHHDQPANTHTHTHVRTHTWFDKRGFEMWKAATSLWQERLSIMSSRILLQVFCVCKARW